MKQILLKSLLALPFVALSTVSCAETKVEAEVADGWTSASTIFYYEKSTYTKEELGKVVRDMTAAIAIATVNPDGSANAAVIRPSMTLDNEYLMFRFGHNQTSRNFKTGKPGIIVVYKYAPEQEDKFERNKGARLEVVYEDNPEKIAELIKANADNGAIDITTFLKIKRIFPLG